MHVQHIDPVEKRSAAARPRPQARPPRQRTHEGRNDRPLVIRAEIERQLLELVTENIRDPLGHAFLPRRRQASRARDRVREARP
ncbi:hypothetical protein GCM10009587_24990 [Microbacterium maritypicum]